MLEVAMLPEFAKAAGREDPDSSYRADCEAMAAELGKDKVDYPFFISMDNAKVHPHGRLRMMKKRQPPPPILKAMREQVFALLAAAAATSPSISQRFCAVLGGHQQEFTALHDTQVMGDTLADALIALYYVLCDEGCSIAKPELFHMHERLLHWEQFMPLPALSPDLHQIIEHMVGTIKARLKAWARQQDKHDPALFQAATWQRAVNDIVSTITAGDLPFVINHCQGSITKWRSCVKIVAADRGVPVHCKVSPPKNKRGGQRKDWEAVDVEEKGTGGGWAPAAYC